MKFWDLIKIANRNLFRNKLRTFLTVAAIFVGSFTLTMTNGLGDGVRGYVENQVKNIESDSVILVRRKIELPEDNEERQGAQEYREDAKTEDENAPIDPASFTMTLPQIEASVRGIDGVKAITPRYPINAEYITLDGQKKYQLSLGMLSDGIVQKVEAGRSINGHGQIVIPLGLGRTLSEDLQSLIGKKATIGYKKADGSAQTQSLEIVGVATKGFQTNFSSFVDSTTAKGIHAEQRAEGVDKFTGFSVQMATSDPVKIEAAKKRLKEQGFEADTFADTQKRIYNGIGIFKAAMGLIAAIALLAASFGIINTLVIAVLERTKEIGLQKALGMSRGKIFAIFSLESVLIGFWGALLGTVVGIAVGLIANKVLIATYAESFEGFNLFAFTLPSMASVMLIVSTIAFIAGVMPAFRASRLNPIDSLRYE